MVVYMLRVTKKGGFSNKFEMAGTSNVVSIDTVLGDEPIVVTPSSFEGLARDCHGLLAFRFPR